MVSADNAMPTARNHRASYELRWASWLLTLTLVGYPFAGMVATVMDWDSTMASIPFRIVSTGLAVALIVKAARSAKRWHIDAWLLAFWGMYLIRLLWDVVVVGMPGAAEALAFFVATVLLPSVAFTVIGTSPIPERSTAVRLTVIGGITCLLASAMQMFGLGAARMVDMERTAGRVFFEAVNPISLGHAAVTTLIAALCLSAHRITGIQRAALLLVGAAAAWTMMLAASRGPFLALAVCAVAFGASGGVRRRIALVGQLMLATLLGADSLIIDRIATAAEDVSSLERLLIQGAAIEQFLGCPVFGSAFSELESLSYPHNLFIEAAMALGIVGLAAICMLVWRAGVELVRQMRAGQTLVPLLLLQFFVAIQFSGSIWGDPTFWATLAITLAVRGRTSAQRPAHARHRPQASQRPAPAATLSHSLP